MDPFSEIFQAMVQDHGKRPRNFRDFEAATHQAEGVNPLTGDHLAIQFQIDDSDTIAAVAFTGKASALALASASIMTGALSGLAISAAREKITQTLAFFSGEEAVPADLPEDEYAVLLEIRQVPHRIRCAALPWNTAAAALSPD